MFTLWLFAGAGRTLAEVPERVEFNRDVRPILSDKCFACHGPDASHRKADLRLDTAAGAAEDLGGGTHAVVPGKPQESELLVRVTSTDKARRMPPPKAGKELTAHEAAVLRRWIEQGAVYQPHWSYVLPRRPPSPEVRDTAWPRNRIDGFILARIEAAGLRPAPETDRVTLLRRLSFDLTGLPPTLAEVEAFLADTNPDACESVVERLLASPHFGERLAMYWLDLVRYADSVGYHGDQEHHITPYRDWVIRAFNGNMPFDRFTREQLAGDLLPGATIEQKIASGYNRLLQTSHEGGVQVKEYLSKYDADRVRNLGQTWLGATLGCAQCHSHKFDPYTLQDFYSLAAFFADVDDLRTFKGGDTNPTKREPEMDVYPAEVRDQAARLEAEVVELQRQITAKAGNLASMKERLAQTRKQLEPLQKLKRRTMITVSVEPRTIRLLKRGDWLDDTGPVMQPAVPSFLPPLPVEDRRPTRLDLANWLTSPNHPQTARIFVNRLWYLFFGAGLCRSLDDTGSQGEWPTHLELLDHLAVEFVESGWDVKQLVRSLVLSSTYRQSSQASTLLQQRDPENRLFARQARYRLPAEMIRDNALAVSGLLVHRVGGPSARPYQPDGYYVYLNFPKRTYKADTDAGQYGRGVYMHWQRTYLHPMLRAFDAPSREECTAQRPVSNTPLAALTMLNDPSFVEAARVLAARIVREGGSAEKERVRWVWRTVLSRQPSEREQAALTRLYRQERARYDGDEAAAKQLLGIGLALQAHDIAAPELAAWTSVARALLNLNETMTRN